MKNSPISEDTSRTLRIIGRLADRLQFDPIDKLGTLEAMEAMVSMCIAVERLRVDQAVWANPAGQYPTDGPEAA